MRHTVAPARGNGADAPARLPDVADAAPSIWERCVQPFEANFKPRAIPRRPTNEGARLTSNPPVRPLDTDHDDNGLGLRADPELVAQGWVRRHLADPTRAEESVKLYTAMGFEVKVQKLEPTDFGPQCQECALSACRTFVMIYTRKNDPPPPDRA